MWCSLNFLAVLRCSRPPNAHLLYGKLGERARGTKSRAVIGYSSGQDGDILPAWDYPPCPARKISLKPYNKSFIDCLSCKDSWILASLLFFFLRVYGPDPVSVHKHAKEELSQYPAILTLHLVNNPYVTRRFCKSCKPRSLNC